MMDITHNFRFVFFLLQSFIVKFQEFTESIYSCICTFYMHYMQRSSGATDATLATIATSLRQFRPAVCWDSTATASGAPAQITCASCTTCVTRLLWIGLHATVPCSEGVKVEGWANGLRDINDFWLTCDSIAAVSSGVDRL